MDRYHREATASMNGPEHHLPLLFHTSKSWLQQHLRKVRVDLNQANGETLHPTRHSLSHSNNADSNDSTATLPMQPLNVWPRMPIQKSPVRPEAAKIRSNMELDVRISIS